jgi:Na+-transporting methylmalonyl-CoA/oxaloacetate decarboxylase gamma subunit
MVFAFLAILIYWMKKTKQGQILTYKLFDDGREPEEAKFE